MAKFETILHGDFDEILRKIEAGVKQGSMTATLEDFSDFQNGDIRCSVRVFERYSYSGSNRVSMNVTLYQPSVDSIYLSAITSGGSQAMFFKLNTVGEESFLDTLKAIL